MNTPYRAMKASDSFKKWDQALKAAAQELGMEPLRHKYNFGRISIHSGELCVAFFSDNKAFFHAGGTKIGNEWLANGGIQLMNSESGHRVKKIVGDTNSLEGLKQGFTAVTKNSECRNWISAPDHIAENPMKLCKLMRLYKPTAKYLRPDNVVHEADFMRNPNIYGALYELLIAAGYRDTVHIRNDCIGKIAHNMLEAAILTGNKHTNKIRNLDPKLIRRLVAIHRGMIYSQVNAQTIKDTNAAIASYQNRKTA
ncbi:hypothetical protein KW429_11305 [Vibrio fluvialis]|nr:hypothetical protein [Vibrio fluvialis]MBY7902444.1 hypothetical protein [Vibrio fluvialis]